MVRERGYERGTPPEKRSRQLGAKLRRDREGGRRLPADAAAAVNGAGYSNSPDPATGRPVGRISSGNWLDLESGTVVPRNGGGFIDSYIRGGLGTEDDR